MVTATAEERPATGLPALENDPAHLRLRLREAGERVWALETLYARLLLAADRVVDWPAALRRFLDPDLARRLHEEERVAGTNERTSKGDIVAAGQERLAELQREGEEIEEQIRALRGRLSAIQAERAAVSRALAVYESARSGRPPRRDGGRAGRQQAGRGKFRDWLHAWACAQGGEFRVADAVAAAAAAGHAPGGVSPTLSSCHGLFERVRRGVWRCRAATA